MKWAALLIRALIQAWKTGGELSIPISKYPPLRHLSIERGEPFRVAVGDTGWILEIDHLTVDMVDRIQNYQHLIKQQFKQAENDMVDARIKRAFHWAIVVLLIDLGGRKVKGWNRRHRFKKEVKRYYREHPADALLAFDALLEFNSNLESFFFQCPPIPRREVPLPPRDGWRALGCKVWGNRGQPFISAPILKIYDILIHEMETDYLQERMRQLSRVSEVENDR